MEKEHDNVVNCTTPNFTGYVVIPLSILLASSLLDFPKLSLLKSMAANLYYHNCGVWRAVSHIPIATCLIYLLKLPYPFEILPNTDCRHGLVQWHDKRGKITKYDYIQIHACAYFLPLFLFFSETILDVSLLNIKFYLACFMGYKWNVWSCMKVQLEFEVVHILQDNFSHGSK